MLLNVRRDMMMDSLKARVARAIRVTGCMTRHQPELLHWVSGGATACW